MTVQALYDEFQKKCALDPELRALKQKIESGSADFSDTAAYSQRVSKLLGKTLSKHIDGIPAGQRETVCKWLLQEQYKDTNSICEVVQKALDEAQGIHLNPVKPKFPAERVEQVAHALEDPTVKPEVIQRRANAPVSNVSMSFHDDYIKENAKIRAKLGMKPTITRYGSGCCSWCSAVAGKYRFGEQPKDIFRRHDNCNCIIIYDNQVLRGHQNEDGGRSKTWEEVKPEDVLADGFSPKIFSQSEAEELQERLMQYLTKPGQGDIMRVADSSSIYHKITDENIQKVPLLDMFGDNEKNKRYQEANKALLREAQKYEPGIEVSIVYDADMNPIKDFGYVVGEVGQVTIQNPGVPFHVFHNHASGETLSYADMRGFVNNPSLLSITATGNTGSVYSLSRIQQSDSFGFGYFLRNKSKAVIFSADGVDFTLEKIASKEARNSLKSIVDKLQPEQRKELADAILSQTEKCLKGGAKYGFKYTESTP